MGDDVLLTKGPYDPFKDKINLETEDADGDVLLRCTQLTVDEIRTDDPVKRAADKVFAYMIHLEDCAERARRRGDLKLMKECLYKLLDLAVMMLPELDRRPKNHLRPPNHAKDARDQAKAKGEIPPPGEPRPKPEKELNYKKMSEAALALAAGRKRA